MTLPSTLKNKTEWTFVGPMGPSIPAFLMDNPILAIDGGAHFTEQMSLWVGDSDSYNKEVKCQHIFKHPIEKEESDLALALRLFREPRHYKFHFWGFLGGRKDHELFNFGEAFAFLEKHQECEILFYGDDGKVQFHFLGCGHWKFTYMGPFSLGTLNKTLVKLTGKCQYPISRSQVLTTLSSLGLSNIASGEISLEADGPVFLYFPEGK